MDTGKLQSDSRLQNTPLRARLTLGGWSEILLCAGLAVGFSTLSNHLPEWPALSTLALVFVALRYGLSKAVLVCLMWVLACSLLQKALGQEPQPLALEHLGPALTALLCGYFSDNCHEKQSATRAARRLDSLQLDEMRQNHYLLLLSHTRLEQRVAGGVDTLRKSLQRLQASLTANSDQEKGLANRATELLLQFDSLTWIQSASLHIVGTDKKPLSQAAATIGEPPALQTNSTLAIESIAQRKMLAVTDIRAALLEKGPLAVAPIVDNDGRIHAIVCVYKIPFFSFNRENLALMAVLAAHIGHMLSKASYAGSTDKKQAFMHAIKRACDDASTFGLPSVLVQWSFHSSREAFTAAKRMHNSVRGLDHPLLDTYESTPRLTLLCSLTNLSEFNLMFERLQQLLTAQHNIDINLNIRDFKVHSVIPGDRPDNLAKTMSLSCNDK